MNDSQKQAAMIRYENLCRTFMNIAEQINQLENTNPGGLDLNFDDTKEKMWNLLEQMLQNKPDWA